jgi:hypothetical protein
MPKFLGTSPLLLSPLTPHVTMHPGQGHIGVTSILQDLGQRLGHIRTYDSPLPKERQAAYGEMGALFEDATDTEFRLRLELEFKRRQGSRVKLDEPKTVLQKKMCIDGIHLIPDLYVPKVKIGECKLTFRNKISNPDNFIDEHWTWYKQTAAYAHALKIYDIEFYVCWCHRWPEPEVYRFKYTPKECKDTWDELVKHKDTMNKRGSTEC